MPEPGAKQCWPTGGEIDIFEFNGNWIEDEVFGSYHWAPPGNGNCGKDKAPIPGKGVKPRGAAADWQMGWHVYAVEWFEDRLDFYLDSTLYFSKTSAQADLPTASMHVILNQAVDAWLFPPATGPAKYGDGVFLRVDYVRYYRHVESSA
jgi:beta-glucanase (GH16 family)